MQASFFDIEVCYARLAAKDHLLKLDAVINWSGLRALMAEVPFDSEAGKRGRPPLCGLMMAKIMILQACNNLSDEMTEFLINDRLSFKRFLGISVNEKSPDAKTIWLWRERIKHGGLDEKIFSWFNNELNHAGFEAQGGQIVDASFVPTHKPTGKHKKQLAEEIPLTPRQMQQIDADATFTKKGNVSYHGYKDHITIDKKHKLIRNAEITTASLHDSQEFEDLLSVVGESASEEDKMVVADSAYKSAESEAMLASAGFISQVHDRAYRNKPLTDEQKATNRVKSTVRVRVEHVFWHMETAMGGMLVHTLGLARAKVKITFKNLAYNLWRFAFLVTPKQQENCA
jgi:IS5 family transposase